MTSELLLEPELEFGGGLRHIDIRFGIMAYGPFDPHWTTHRNESGLVSLELKRRWKNF